MQFGRPMLLFYGQVDGWKYTHGHLQIIASADGTTNIVAHPVEFPIPKGNFVILTTPYEIDGEKPNEYELHRSISLVSGTLIVAAGKNFLRQIVFDGVVEAASGAMSTYSDIVRIPSKFEGPFLSIDNWKIAEAIIHELPNSALEIRPRLELALEYLFNATQAEEPFPLYYIAIELVSGRSGIGIASKLA